MTKWYLYVDDEVTGPYTPKQLEGRIEEESLVCKAGSENWVQAGSVTDLEACLGEIEPEEPRGSETAQQESGNGHSTPGSTEGENEDRIEPTLEELRSICEAAENDDLLAEYEDHWDTYDAEERRVILEEIENRGLLDP